MNPLPRIGQYLVEERSRWLLWAPVGIGAGIGYYFSLEFEPPVWALFASPMLLMLALLVRSWLGAVVPVVALLCFALGFNASQIDTRLSYTPMLDREIGPVRVSGLLVFTEVMPEGVRLTLKDPEVQRLPAERTPVKLRVKLNNKTLQDIPPPGAKIGLWANLNPFSEPVMPGANDFRRQGFFRQLGGLGFSFSKIDLIDAAPPIAKWRDRFSLMFENARMALARHVYAHLDGDVAAMTATRLNGEQTAISEPVIEAMRIAGLAHLLSTSGFHVTIMGLLIYFPLRALLALIPFIALRYPIKKWAAFGAIISTTLYSLLVGSQPATLRSLLMTGIAMLAVITDRRSSPMRLVVLSAALAMLLAPDALLGPSFQMSFAAVFCLIATHEKSLGWMVSSDHKALEVPGWVKRPTRYLWSIFTTSLIATAATTPFAVYHFQTISGYGFIANMLAIPLTSFWVMPCILAAYFAAPLGWDGPFIVGAGSGIDLTIKIAQRVAAWPYSIFYVPAMPDYVLVMLVLGGLWLFLWRQRWRYLGILPLLIGCCYPLYTPKPDIMIAPDGKEWAIRLDDGRLAVSNLDREAFIVEQWQQRLAMPPTVDVTELTTSETAIRCDGIGCVYRGHGHIIAFPALEAGALEDCAQADTVVAPYLIKTCAAPTVIDDPDYWRHGAQAITFDGDTMRIAANRTRRASRPWSPGYRRPAPDAD